MYNCGQGAKLCKYMYSECVCVCVCVGVEKFNTKFYCYSKIIYKNRAAACL